MKRIYSYERGHLEARVYARRAGYLVRLYINGALYPAADYEADDIADATGTADAMVNAAPAGAADPAKLTFEDWCAANAAHMPQGVPALHHWLRAAWDAALLAGR